MRSYSSQSLMATQWLANQIDENGAYRAHDDLACYYKSPLLFFLQGKAAIAHKLLDYIKYRFMQPNGDFITAPNFKSHNGVFNEHWAYINGWIALTAHKMGRFDISFPAYHYLQQFANTEIGGFNFNRPFGQGNDVIDTLATAHLGLAFLAYSDVNKARSAGDALEKMWCLQPAKNDYFLLRMNQDGKLIETYPTEMAALCYLSATESDQAYFMLGYPISFLCRLYQATNEKKYLVIAKQYLDFAMNCKGNVTSFHFSHKLAWGAAIFYHLTQENKYRQFALEIADYLVGIQNAQGYWHEQEPAHTHFDQTAEIALWLNEIELELAGQSFEVNKLNAA